MSDNPRGEISESQLTRLQEALGAWIAAEAALRAAVLDVVDAGGTVDQVAAVTGLQTATVESWTGLDRVGTTPATEEGAPSPSEVDEVSLRRHLREGTWQQKVAAAEAFRSDDEQDLT